jgi:hypothetical protein
MATPTLGRVAGEELSKVSPAETWKNSQHTRPGANMLENTLGAGRKVIGKTGETRKRKKGENMNEREKLGKSDNKNEKDT